MSDIIPQDVPQKQCSTCKKFYPTSKEFYHVWKYSKDGFRSTCKKCRAVPYKSDIIDGLKRCGKCKERKPATSDYFGVSNKARTGFHSTCKECRHSYDAEHIEQTRQYNAMRRQTHKEEIREQKKRDYAAHAEYNRAHKRQYRKEHPDKTALAALAVRNHYNAHKEEARNYQREYRRKFPEKIAVFGRVRGNNRRARKQAVPGTYTAQQIRDLLKRQKHQCYYCFSKFEKKNKGYLYHVEHTFPLARITGTDIPANDINYLVLACPTCNLKKGDKFPWEFFQGGRLL